MTDRTRPWTSSSFRAWIPLRRRDDLAKTGELYEMADDWAAQERAGGRPELTRGEAWALLTNDSTHRDHESARARLRELTGTAIDAVCPYCAGRGGNNYSLVAPSEPLGDSDDYVPCHFCGGHGVVRPRERGS